MDPSQKPKRESYDLNTNHSSVLNINRHLAGPRQARTQEREQRGRIVRARNTCEIGEKPSKRSCKIYSRPVGLEMIGRQYHRKRYCAPLAGGLNSPAMRRDPKQTTENIFTPLLLSETRAYDGELVLFIRPTSTRDTPRTLGKRGVRITRNTFGGLDCRIKASRETSAGIAFKVKPRNFVTAAGDTRKRGRTRVP